MPRGYQVDTNKSGHENLYTGYPSTGRQGGLSRKQHQRHSKRYPRIATPDDFYNEEQQVGPEHQRGRHTITYNGVFSDSYEALKSVDENHMPSHAVDAGADRRAGRDSPVNHRYYFDEDCESYSSTDKGSDLFSSMEMPTNHRQRQESSTYGRPVPPLDLQRLGPPQHKLKFGPFYEDDLKDREIESPLATVSQEELDEFQDSMEGSGTYKKRSWFRKNGQVPVPSTNDGTAGKIKRNRSLRKHKDKSRSASTSVDNDDNEYYQVASQLKTPSEVDPDFFSPPRRNGSSASLHQLQQSPQRARKRDIFAKLFKA
ncbi:hypothetical protein TRICI_004760 [Trichomonascus ciferrii]|uniref:Pal1 cell morphology protein n=1 Tax=Trichomonascus ciferrii TaxID=44093 RepID=A0A642UZH4_9ASCO|nr:hypothetical protein TRICI_004760 [Trichomonascus ciferrii]